MNRRTLALISALALVAASPSLAMAKSIKNFVSSDSLATLCSSVGVNNKVTAEVTMPNGDKVTGTIDCEAEDMTPGSDDALDSSASVPGSDDDVSGASHVEDDQGDTEDDHGGASGGDGGGDDGDNGGDHVGAGGGDNGGGGDHGGDDNGGDDDGGN